MVKPTNHPRAKQAFAAHGLKRENTTEQGLISNTATDGSPVPTTQKNLLPLAPQTPRSSPKTEPYTVENCTAHSKSFQPVTISIPMVTNSKWENKCWAFLITQSKERNTKADSHFCDWRTLKERALCRPSWRGFGSERDDSASSQQHWFPALYQTQHYKCSKTNKLKSVWGRAGGKREAEVRKKSRFKTKYIY